MRRFIVALLSERSKNNIKKTIEYIKEQSARLAGASKLSAVSYYTLLSSQFRREMIAVLQGRKSYAENLQKALVSSPLLRRNIHRLEKGLIMQPRRPVFAVDYIGETVTAFAKASAWQTLDPAELAWAHDVLQQYFQLCASHPMVDAAKSRFIAVVAANPAGFNSAGARSAEIISADASSAEVSSAELNPPAVPYRYADLPKSDISFAALSQLFKQRRSVRWFLPTAVPKELIYQAVEVASQAPSACNRQPFRFDLLANPHDAQKVAALAMGTAGFEHNIQCLLVVVGDLSCYPAERDRHVIYIDASLATMQLMLALETLGLASCPINWPDIESRERLMQQKLKLPVYQRPVMLLAVGYADPAGGIAFSQKKSAALLIREVADVD